MHGNSDVKTCFLALDPHAKNQGHRLNNSAMRVQTDKQMDRRYPVHYLPASGFYAVDNEINFILPITLTGSLYSPATRA